RRRQGRGGLGGRDHLEAALAQRPRQPGAEGLVVVDEQQAGRAHVGRPACTGTAMRAVVPPRSTLSKVTAPPSRSTIVRARKRPSPMPLPAGFVVKNGSPMRASTSGGMP